MNMIQKKSMRAERTWKEKNQKALIICGFLLILRHSGAGKLCRQLTINYDNNLWDISHLRIPLLSYVF